ncbi:cysteine desulfurase family protein [Oceanomicrobium pacificus]|uniref:Cysteine desulfurase n=1 Tax=Oceanomicrobium pacificus TaxID=2692916 RepID=A0A6B0TWI7_9RHOB|nr:cysteine desulfurase family protein [Oceanomicrobium pacificus]MXU65868.1 aminotransferase class V-fold PLP-dependent enzyme [Oceanomicrobium pacificus]
MTARHAYLDWNATAPLRAEARDAMIAACDIVGNPSSVHAAGRAARALVERSRAEIAEALGASGADIVFTSGATEAAALALHDRDIHAGAVEHDAVAAWVTADLAVDGNGQVTVDDPASSAVQRANSETGILQDLPEGLFFCDAVQAIGKLPFAFAWSGAEMAAVSAHKFGGPKGIGALVLRQGRDVAATLRGGGQEQGRRSGTENVIGIAGFAAALKAAVAELESGAWEAVAERRDRMEAHLLDAASDLVIPGLDAPRLPNTSCLAVPGWKGETQVMQMDLAGYAISAGSACSSGKVRESRVLAAMGFDKLISGGAIRVSMGTATTDAEVDGFASTWIEHYTRFRKRSA